MEVEVLKDLLGISKEDSSKDAVLQFTLSQVEDTILNYCNLEEIPKRLINMVYRMAIDLYRSENFGEEESKLQVSSLSEGDTSTSFSNVSDSIQGTLLKDYKGQLNRFRKVRW